MANTDYPISSFPSDSCVLGDREEISAFYRYNPLSFTDEDEMDCDVFQYFNYLSMSLRNLPSNNSSSAPNTKHRAGSKRACTNSRSGTSGMLSGLTSCCEILDQHYVSDHCDHLDFLTDNSLWKLNVYDDCDKIVKGMKRNLSTFGFRDCYRSLFNWYQRFCRAYGFQFIARDHSASQFRCLTCDRFSDFRNFACQCLTYIDKLDSEQIEAFLSATCTFQLAEGGDEVSISMITNYGYYYYFANHPLTCCEREKPFLKFSEDWRLGEIFYSIKNKKILFHTNTLHRLTLINKTRSIHYRLAVTHCLKVSYVTCGYVFLPGEIDVIYPP